MEGDAIFANDVFFDKRDQSLLIPAYLAVVVKSLRNMDETRETLDVLLTIVVRMQFAGVDPALRDECLDKMLLRFNDVPMHLDPTTTNISWKGDLAMLTSRINLVDHLFTSSDKEKGYGQWGKFPFDHPEIFIRIELSGHTVKQEGVFKGYKVRYTLHEVIQKGASQNDAYERVRTMVSFKETTDALPAFELMLSGVSVKFPQSKRKASKSWYHPTVVYRVPLLRHPFPIIRTMIIPLLITNFATVSTFRMRVFPPPHEGFNERTATLVTILLALFAFLSVAHSALPDLPVNTFMDQVIFQSIVITFLGLLDNMWAYETVKWAALKVSDGSVNAYARQRRKVALFRRQTIGPIADVSIYEYDERDMRSFDFLHLFLSKGLNTSTAAVIHRTVRFVIFVVVIYMTLYLILRLSLKVREYRRVLRVNEAILIRPDAHGNKGNRYSSGAKYDAKNFSVPFTDEFVPFMDIMNSNGKKVHAAVET